MNSYTQTNSVFDLLPEEGWLLVFKRIQNLADLLACFEASTEWKSIIKSSSSLYTTLTFYKCVSLLYNQLSLKDLLNCRLVCKQWKHGLDSFLEHDQIHMPFLNAKQSFSGLQFFPLTHCLKVKLDLTQNAIKLCPKTIHDFQLEISNFDQTPSNLHTVCVSDVYCHENKVASQDLLPFFKSYGIHIKHLCLHLELVHASNVLKYLQTLLQNTPNLKSLAINESLRERMFDQGYGYNKVPHGKKYDLPVLPELQLLEVNARNFDMGRFVLQKLVIKNSQNLTNLSILSVSIYSNDELLILQRVGCAVKELHLYIQLPIVSLSQILQTTERFAKSLKTLKISKAHNMTFPFQSQVVTTVELPNVEELSLLYANLADPLIFIYMDLKKLQRLTLHSLHSKYTVPNQQNIDYEVRRCKKAIVEGLNSASKLWPCFPELKEVSIIKMDGSIQTFDKTSLEDYTDNVIELSSIWSESESGRIKEVIRRQFKNVRSHLRSLGRPLLRFFTSSRRRTCH